MTKIAVALYVFLSVFSALGLSAVLGHGLAGTLGTIFVFILMAFGFAVAYYFMIEVARWMRMSQHESENKLMA